MISVADALERVLALGAPLPVEEVPLARAAGRVLARAVTAVRDQPPFAASAMDGYAINALERDQDAQFKVIGESAAGHGFAGRVGPGQAVRIFTGAPVPEGADFVVIQEDVSRQGSLISLVDVDDAGPNIRPAGADFTTGARIEAPRRLAPQDVALMAAMNIARVPVTRRPVVALISTGDELAMPGDSPGPDQIIASNTFGLKAMIEAEGCTARLLPIARDNPASLRQAFDLARGTDLVVTIGGASVGDHDIVGSVAADLGLDRAFYKIAMRPGKPLMAGRLADSTMIGLPGNPVSAMVCGHVFVLPLLRVMLGLPAAPAALATARLAAPLGPNGPRAHYMRASVAQGEIIAFDRQDSSLLTVFAAANALLLRPPHDPARAAGETVDFIAL